MAPIPRPDVITAENMAQWQKDVSADLWRMVRDINSYGPALLDMLNTCVEGMNHSPKMVDRMYFKAHHDMLRLSIGYGQACAPIYNALKNTLGEHVMLDAAGNVVETTDTDSPA